MNSGLLAGALAVAAMLGCGGAGAPGPALDTASPGLGRAAGRTTCILPTLHAPGTGQGLPAPDAVADVIHSELLVARLGDVVPAGDSPIRLGDGRLRRIVVTLARGERTIAADFAPLLEVLPSSLTLFSWVDERAREGREKVRTDLEPTDLRADDGLARFQAVDGTVNARLVDLATGEVLWQGRREYSTPPDFDAALDTSALDRARIVAAGTLARALEAAWVAASD